MNIRIRRLVRAALIAAVYVALSAMFSLTSFLPAQLRVSEALTLLPVVCPEAVVGVTVGCFISNMLFAGLTAPIDMVVGTLATLLAALATRRLRNIRWRGLPLLASLPPVLFNAVIVGTELSFLFFYPPTLPIVFANMLSVGAGQVLSCCVLGVLLVWGIEKNPRLRGLFADTKTLV